MMSLKMIKKIFKMAKKYVMNDRLFLTFVTFGFDSCFIIHVTYTANVSVVSVVILKKKDRSILKIDHLQRLYLRIYDLECYHDVHI